MPVRPRNLPTYCLRNGDPNECARGIIGRPKKNRLTKDPPMKGSSMKGDGES